VKISFHNDYDTEVITHDEVIITAKNKILANPPKSYFMDMAVQKARERIMAREDAEIFKALDACAYDDDTEY
jgi:hypothetical protein